ncbi:MAG: TldD/PmbA family protein [Chloroflexota bacterium]
MAVPIRSDGVDDPFSPAAEAALAEARGLGVFLIARFEHLRERTVIASAGERRQITSSRRSGVGMHVVRGDGRIGFASTDDLSPSSVAALVGEAVAIAAVVPAPGRSEPFMGVGADYGAPCEVREGLAARERFDAVDLDAESAQVERANVECWQRRADTAVRTTYACVDDSWRIVRSDGVDVSFSLPRAYVRHQLSVRTAGESATGSAYVSGLDERVLFTEETRERLGKSAAIVERRIRETAGAGSVPHGPARLVMDFALAKGFAHEAIGHAAEADLVRASYLGRAGRFRLGERVGATGVRVEDGPIAGDYAEQRVGAYGGSRPTITIIDDGVLVGGLGDPFFSPALGLPHADCARAASYRDRPLPRMSNIRLLHTRASRYIGDPDRMDTDDVLATLRAGGVPTTDRPTYLLVGYRGGQADPHQGTFLFTAAFAYDLTDGGSPKRGVTLAGSSEAALRCISAAFGGPRFDAMGSCTKDGSTVPSSGGSHRLLVIEPTGEVAVGGSGR